MLFLMQPLRRGSRGRKKGPDAFDLECHLAHQVSVVRIAYHIPKGLAVHEGKALALSPALPDLDDKALLKVNVIEANSPLDEGQVLPLDTCPCARLEQGSVETAERADDVDKLRHRVSILKGRSVTPRWRIWPLGLMIMASSTSRAWGIPDARRYRPNR